MRLNDDTGCLHTAQVHTKTTHQHACQFTITDRAVQTMGITVQNAGTRWCLRSCPRTAHTSHNETTAAFGGMSVGRTTQALTQWQPCLSDIILYYYCYTATLHWDSDCCLAGRTFIGLHKALLTEDLVMAYWQSQTCTALQAVEAFASRFLHHNLPPHNVINMHTQIQCHLHQHYAQNTATFY